MPPWNWEEAFMFSKGGAALERADLRSCELRVTADGQVEQLRDFGGRPAAVEQLHGCRPDPGEQAFAERRCAREHRGNIGRKPRREHRS